MRIEWTEAATIRLLQFRGYLVGDLQGYQSGRSVRSKRDFFGIADHMAIPTNGMPGVIFVQTCAESDRVAHSKKMQRVLVDAKTRELFGAGRRWWLVSWKENEDGTLRGALWEWTRAHKWNFIERFTVPPLP